MSFPWNIPVAQNATIPAWRQAVNDALQYLREATDLEAVEKTSAAALAADERFVICPSGTFTLTLPVTTDLPIRPVVVKNTGTGVITITGAGFDTVNGLAGYLLSTQLSAVVLLPNGSNWEVVAEAGDRPIPSGVGVYELDGSGFNNSTTTFVGLLPVEPDLSEGKTCLINLSGVNVLRRVASSPGTFEFVLSGDTNQDVTFGAPPEAGTIAQAVLAKRSGNTLARYLYLSGSVGALEEGAVPFGWVLPEGIVGTIEAGAPGCTASALAAASTDDAVMELTLAGIPFGTVTFPAGGGDPTFTIPSDVSVASGAVLYPVNPSPANSTLAGVLLTLRVKLDG